MIEWFQWLHAVKKHMGGDVVVLRIKFDPADSIESTCEARLLATQNTKMQMHFRSKVQVHCTLAALSIESVGALWHFQSKVQCHIETQI